MQIVLKIVLVLVAFLMMGLGAMDLVFAMDPIGTGWPAVVSGGLANVAGIAAIFFALSSTTTRRWTTGSLAVVLFVVRLARLAVSHPAYWEMETFPILVMILLLPPLIVALFAIVIAGKR